MQPRLGMPDQDQMALVIATHESGHAIVAVALNLGLERVQVCDGDPRYILVDGMSTRRRDCLLTLMGGCAAEELVFGRAIGGGSDDVQIADLLEPDDDE